MGLDTRADFPVTETTLTSPVDDEERPLVYLDHAASTHAPRPVLDAHQRFLSQAYANVHRGAHHLSEVSTEAYEDVRWKCKAFVGARPDQDVIFTQNTTAALDLAAHLVEDEPGYTLVSGMEHHSNDLPHRARGPTAHVEVTEEGRFDLADLEAKLETHKTKLVAVTMASNVTGIRPPVAEITDLAHRYGARVLVDGAQGLAHLPIDLRDIGDTGGPDLFAAAGHKAYAPMGAAFLVAPRELVDQADPYRPGGGTVSLVEKDQVTWKKGTDRHEGGTPNVPGIVAMGAALDYLRAQGVEKVRAHERELLAPMLEGLSSIPGVEVLGHRDPEERVGAVGFTVEGVHHRLVSQILDNEFGIATRNGWFCAHPYLARLLGLEREIDDLRQRVQHGASAREPGFPGAVRASLGIYNTREEVEHFVRAMDRVADKRWEGSYAFSDGSNWRPART
jgi:selenocysteine lyase/cysteine desulfurase